MAERRTQRTVVESGDILELFGREETPAVEEQGRRAKTARERRNPGTQIAGVVVHDDDGVGTLEAFLERAGAGPEVGDHLLRRYEVVPPDLDAGRLEPMHERDGRRPAHILGCRATLEREAGNENLRV